MSEFDFTSLKGKKQDKKDLFDQAYETKQKYKLYTDKLDKIIKETGLTKEELIKRLNAKREELKGLISEEGAIFIVAKELGVNVELSTQAAQGNIKNAFGAKSINGFNSSSFNINP